MAKCVLILPYFGKFKNYFPLFLKTCEANSDTDFLLITDNTEPYDYPKNFRIIRCSFEEFRSRIQEVFDFPVHLSKPYKLCDFKPAYGLIFEDEISGYDYWGHCDCDLLFGDLDEILPPILDEGYDKLFASGHLTIYRNSPDNNRRFMLPYQGEEIYKRAFSTDEIVAFDEDCSSPEINPNRDNVHSIFLESGANLYLQDLSFNAAISFSRFVNKAYDAQTRSFVELSKRTARYYWADGRIIEAAKCEASIGLEFRDYLYIHLQQRNMRMGNLHEYNGKHIEIAPDRFIPVSSVPVTINELRPLLLHLPTLYKWDCIVAKLRRRLR